MKKIFFLFVVSLLYFSSDAQFSRATLQASGLTCAMCSKAVKVALQKVPFVSEVKVNIKKQEYSVAFKENSKADFDELKKAVEDAGFSVASLKVTGTFADVNVEMENKLLPLLTKILFQQRSIKSTVRLLKWNASGPVKQLNVV